MHMNVFELLQLTLPLSSVSDDIIQDPKRTQGECTPHLFKVFKVPN